MVSLCLHLLVTVKVLLSHVQLFATPWTIASQAPLSMEFSRQNTRVGCHSLLQEIFLIQGDPGLLHGRQILLPSELSRKPNRKQGVFKEHFLNSISSISLTGFPM